MMKLTCPYIHLFYFIFIIVICCKPNLAASGKKTIVKVNGVVLTEYDLQEALNQIMPAGVFHGGFSSKKRMEKRPEAKEKMIEKELFYQEAVRVGIRADKKLIDERLNTTIQKFGSKKRFLGALKENNMGEKDFIKRLEKENIVNKFIKTEIKGKAIASDDFIKEHYTNNKEKFLKPKTIKLWHMVIKVDPSSTKEEREEKRKKAKGILEKIKKGEDRAKLAWDYSDDRYKVKGGNYVYMHMGMLDPELEKIVFNLEIGKLSDIIETRFGYHIAQVDEIQPPQQLSLKEASPKIQTIIAQKNEKRIRNALIKKLREKAKIVEY